MFTSQKINIQKVLSLIPEDLLASLSRDTKVDYCAKVLFGQRIFKRINKNNRDDKNSAPDAN